MIVGWLVVLAATGGAVDKKLPVVPQEPAPKKPESRVHPTPERLAGTWELTHHNGIPSGNFKVTRVFGKDGSQTVTSNVTQPNVRT
jgi:hypothetical protein